MNFTFNKYRLFTFFGLFLVGLNLLSIISAVFGIFFKEIIISYFLIAGLVLAVSLFLNRQVIISNLPHLPVLIISLVFILFLSFGTTPSIFSGRDQGSLSEAAIRLSQNHNLYFSSPASQEFFKIYGPGRALNFPGFDYSVNGQLITHFPLGYISWLAAFYSVFGQNGLIVANGVSFFLFLLSFFLIARMYMNSAMSFWAFILIISSFAFSWFFKFTLSENLALGLFWFGLWEFLLFIKRRGRTYLLTAFFSFIILAFSRIEALAIIPMALLVLSFKFHRQKLSDKSILKSWMVIPVILTAVFYFFSLPINWPFYKGLTKGFIAIFTEDVATSSLNPSSSLFYLLKILGAYAILPFIVLALIGIVYFLATKNFLRLIPFIIPLPVWFYLISPGISMDHPWMLRRFLFALIPIAILYSVMFLQKVLPKAYAYTAVIMILVFNLYISIPYYKASENKNLLSEVREIGNNFSPDDLILVDREATGDGWSMMTGPLNFVYGKQAVYFFNPSDLDKINRNLFSNVYFIIPEKNEAFYSGIKDRLFLRREYRIETNFLDIETGVKSELYNRPVNLPQEKTLVTYGKIYQLRQEE